LCPPGRGVSARLKLCPPVSLNRTTAKANIHFATVSASLKRCPDTNQILGIIQNAPSREPVGSGSDTT
jgi:hypothetical protein